MKPAVPLGGRARKNDRDRKRRQRRSLRVESLESRHLLAVNGLPVFAAEMPEESAVPAVTLQVSEHSGFESQTRIITVTATAEGPVVGDQTVDLTVTGTNVDASDYFLSDTTITIPHDRDHGSVGFTVRNDDLVEASVEVATLTISNPTSGIALGSVASRDISIHDNDSALLSIRDVVISEAAGVASFEIELSQPVDTAIDFTFATVDSTATSPDDFTPVSERALSIPAMTTWIETSVPVASDGVIETSEDFLGRIQTLSTSGRDVRLADLNPQPLVGSLDGIGYALDIEVVGDLAFLSSNGLKIVDISTPTNPTLIGSVDSVELSADVEVVGHLAYLADRAGGLKMIDISDPAAPTLVGTFVTSGRAEGIDIVGNHAYIAITDDSFATGKLEVVDVTEVGSPSLISTLVTSDRANDVKVDAEVAYVGTRFGIDVIDVSDPADPIVMRSVATPGEANHVTLSAGLAYVSMGREGLQILDVSSPTSIASVGSYDKPGNAAVSRIELVGDLAYVSSSRSGVDVLDLSEISTPDLIGNIGTIPSAVTTRIVGGHAFTSVVSSGLRVYRLDRIDPPGSTLSSVEMPGAGDAQAIQLNGDLAYVGTDDDGVVIVDVADPHSPMIRGAVDTGGQVFDVAVDGNRLYAASVAFANFGLKIIDIADSEHPSVIGELTLPQPVYSVVANDEFAYLGARGLDGDPSLYVVDIRDPVSPAIVGTLSMTRVFVGSDLSLLGETLYLTVSDGQLHVIDVSDPADPTFVESLSVDVESVTVDGSHLFAAGRDGFHLFDITTPTSPSLLGFLPPLPNTILGEVAVAGTLAYVNAGQSGVDVIDVSNAETPVFLRNLDTQALQTRDLAASGTLVYAATRLHSSPSGSVEILDTGLSSSATATITPPVSGAVIVDNGDPDYSTSGDWTTVTGRSKGHLDDFDYANTKSGANAATWTFDHNHPGQYLVSVSYREYTNRAINAPFTIFDDGGNLGTVRINQVTAADDRMDDGTNFEDLGTFNLLGNQLVVELTDFAGGLVVADAVRIERIGEPIDGPEIQVTADGTDIADGVSIVDFGNVPLGISVAKTINVSNIGNADLEIVDPISVPTGFSIAMPPGTNLLAPGETTSFSVRIDTSSIGSFSGDVSVENSDADEDPFTFSIQGDVVSTKIIDDGDPGFTSVGGLGSHVVRRRGFAGDFRYGNSGSGSEQGIWTFGTTPGVYRVSATWIPFTNRATNAPYQISDDGVVIAARSVNQQVSPDDLRVGSTWFEDLGTFEVHGRELVVTLSDDADGLVVADAVRVERIADIEVPDDLRVTVDGSAVADDTGLVDFGSVARFESSIKTFEVTNHSSGPMTLSTPISIPPGFGLVSSFGSTTLATGESTTFSIEFDTSTVGPQLGTVSFTHSDAGSPYSFVVQGVVAPNVIIVDDGSADFETAGVWIDIDRNGHDGGFKYAATTGAASTATWIFDGLAPGIYQISATWHARSNRAVDAPFTILDGSASLRTIEINQQVGPAGFSDDGSDWEELGPFEITSGQLVVELRSSTASAIPGQIVIADAIRVERIG